MKRWCLSILACSALASCTVNLGGDDAGTTSGGATSGTTTTGAASTTATASTGATATTGASSSGTSGTGTTGSIGTSSSGSTTGSVITCTEAGGTCVGLTPENCVGGTVLPATQYSCGSGDGAECCLAAGTCQTDWPRAPECTPLNASCNCNDNTIQEIDPDCGGPFTCAQACCTHGGVIDGGCVPVSGSCNTVNNLCCNSIACIPTAQDGNGICGYLDAGSCLPLSSACSDGNDNCCGGATCLPSAAIGFGTCGFATGACGTSNQSCSADFPCCSGLVCTSAGICNAQH